VFLERGHDYSSNHFNSQVSCDRPEALASPSEIESSP
jgi:hypothetical protein